MNGKKDSRLKIIWRLFYPLLLYMGISIVIEVIAYIVLAVKTMVDAGPGGMLGGPEQLQLIISQMLESYLSVAYYMTILSAAVTIPFLYLFYRKDRKKRLALGMEIVYRKGSLMEHVLICLVAFGACIGGNNLILGSGLMEIDPGYQQVAEILYSAPLWMQLLGTGLIAPVCEELIFRGLLYNRLKEHTSVNMAMFLSSLFFGMYHGNIVQMIYAMALGYLMAYVYEKYHSFFAALLFHAVANIVSVLITETGIFDFMYSSQLMMLLSGSLGIVVVLMGVRLIRDTVHLEPKDPVSKVEV